MDSTIPHTAKTMIIVTKKPLPYLIIKVRTIGKPFWKSDSSIFAIITKQRKIATVSKETVAKVILQMTGDVPATEM